MLLREPIESGRRTDLFLKEKPIISYVERDELSNWLTEHLSPAELAEKFIVVLQDHHTETHHTHIHLPHNSPNSVSGEIAELEKEFNERANRWAKETGFHSSPVIRFMHKDYQSIMAKGKVVIPLILNRMKTQPDDWFWALTHIAGFDAGSQADSFDGAVRAWIKWGADNNYITK